MNKQDYEQKKRECWEEFKNATFNGDISYSTCSALDFAFDRAYALGKQEKDADTVIQGWVARDEDADCPFFYNSKPYRKKKGYENGYWVYGLEIGLRLDPSLFPDLTWESDPLPIEIIIKQKNNG